ncbi:elongation of very long chain fatty acids protein 7-like isoform X1 [Eupeodes corollae]|uniref:elongation of very long chain fatty acids protein 7-like isoform X1 n=1 Tax=Eupeodes corollae TaxID=290404 RepID=UPI0024928839|nr:elongation of very long chain fatty acids protein 7-like isoform X1 [Eupeodes corollae]
MVNFIEKYFDVTPDPRSADWFLIGSLKQTCLIVACYAFFVKKLGPSLMKNRKPFELRTIIRIYNISQICINGYLVFKASPYILGRSIWTGRCFSVDESNPETERYTLWLSYTYCLVKILDLLDTVFFVLRKRYNQVSFLHFYHHLLLALLAPVVYHYNPNGHMGVMGYINSIVHTVMYFYYFLSNLSPNMKNSIWWKKYITLMQMGQFVFLTGFFLYPLINGEFCGYPFKFLYFALAQNFVFMILFSNFYIKTYVTKAKLKPN